MTLKVLAKKVNDIICDDGGLLLGSCKSSLDGNKNYLLIVVSSLIFQYILPIVDIFVLIPLFVGNSITIGFIDLLHLVNPLFILLYIPLTLVDAVAILFMLIFNGAFIIIYWALSFKNIGSFSIWPFMLWILSIILFFVPVVGPFLSIAIGIVPWMTIMDFFHWYVYRY